MILYQLLCHKGHDFEAWFRDSTTYDSQSATGDVACPFCGTTQVNKAPMAPHLATGGDKGRKQGVDEERAHKVAEKILEAVDGISRKVEENCEFVGDEFAEEAKRIHYGESEERDIYGEATDEEAEELDEEGVDYVRFPFVRRRDDN
jgi:hypothetical protein